MKLTDEEVKFFLNDVIQPEKITDIYRNKEGIHCEIITKWEDNNDNFSIADEVTLTQYEIISNFPITLKDEYKWQQYLLVKNCHHLLKDNQYIKINKNN